MDNLCYGCGRNFRTQKSYNKHIKKCVEENSKPVEISEEEINYRADVSGPAIKGARR